jgi:hypothetical protein
MWRLSSGRVVTWIFILKISKWYCSSSTTSTYR